jgi:chemotaxis protein MotB
MAGSGGAWKVAYADFVTAMMAFFLVMWITSQDDETKQAIGGYFQDPWGTAAEDRTPSPKTPAGLKGDAPFADTPTGILPQRWPQPNTEDATEQDPGAASVWQQKQQLHLLNNTERNLPALIINFDEGSAELTKQAQQRLTDLLPALVGKRNKIELRAHSTRRPLAAESSYRDHWQLCYARSQATMDFLEKHGVELDRIRLSQSAAYEPLTTRLESAWQDANNCVEVFLLTEIVDRVPGTAANGEVQQPRERANEPAAQAAEKHAATEHTTAPGH